MREIGRLRELSFRQVQEGTENALDIDRYDHYYRHLILWDEEELEIIGSYRIGEAGRIFKKFGIEGLYTSTLFNFDDAFIPYLESGIEMGRSFIQLRYQGKRSLDYLWFGIGAYLHQHPEIQYMFGPVSMSNSLPEDAKKTIAGFFPRFSTITQYGSNQDCHFISAHFKILPHSTRFLTKLNTNSRTHY